MKNKKEIINILNKGKYCYAREIGHSGTLLLTDRDNGYMMFLSISYYETLEGWKGIKPKYLNPQGDYCLTVSMNEERGYKWLEFKDEDREKVEDEVNFKKKTKKKTRKKKKEKEDITEEIDAFGVNEILHK